MTERNFSDVCRELTSRKSYPLFVTLELSLACNLRCVHCYNFDRSRPLKAENELTPAEIQNIIGQVAAEGCLMISFTGGEALAHPHLADFVKHARAHRLAVKVKSNATLLTHEKARLLFEAGVTDIDVSIYGASAESHDGFTRVKGSFEKTWRGVLAARDAGIKVALTIILHQGNYREVRHMVDKAKSEGVEYSVSWELTARYDGTTGAPGHQIGTPELKELYTSGLDDIFPLAVPNPAGEVRCACARMVCGINSKGDVYPCIGAPIFAGSLRERSFGEIWRNSEVLNKIRSLGLEDFKKCSGCGIRQYCQRSSGSAYTDTGDYTGTTDLNCDSAALLRDLMNDHDHSAG